MMEVQMADLLCPPFPVVPAAPVCPGKCEDLSLCKLPRNYPRTIAVSTLQDAYTFTSDSDFNEALSLNPVAYNIGSSGVIITDDPCTAEIKSDTLSFYSYIDVIYAQEAKEERDTKWVLDYTARLCTLGSTGITKGPSYISLFNAIQEVMTPPTVTPGIVPGKTQKGTRIPKPKGECKDGTWVLTYVDGKLEWECDNDSSMAPTTICEHLTITGVRILTSSGGDEITGTITTETIQNNPNPVIEVSWEYTDWYMPEVGVLIRLSYTAQEDGKKTVASVGWMNSPYMDATVAIGPVYTEQPEQGTEDEEPEPVTIEDTSEFQFSWSAVTCYTKNQQDNNYSDTDIRVDVSVPSCPSLSAAQEVITATCTPATGVLSVSKIEITDEFGIVYPDNHIGENCDSVRSGVFYVYVEYENATDSMYIADEELDGIRFTNPTDMTIGYDHGKAPTELGPGDAVGYSYKVNFKLFESVCSGELTLGIPSVPGAGTVIYINHACEKCPGFKITNIELRDTISGQLIQDTWNVGCVNSASRRVTVVATIASDSEFGGYRNKDNDKIKFKATPDVGIELTEPQNNTIPVPDVAAGNTASVSVDYIVTTTKKLQVVETLEEVSANVEFEVTADATNADPNADAVILSVTKICGVLGLVPGSVRLYRVMGSQFELVTMPINDCAPGAYEFVLGYDLRNVSKDATFSDYVTVESSIACREGNLAVGPYSHSTTKEITNLRPGEIVAGYTPRFTVQTTEDSLSGQVQISFEISEYSIDGSKTVGINEDCPESSSSSGSASSDPCAGDPNCCPWLKSRDEEWVEVTKDPEDGRCVVDLTDKAKNIGKNIIGGDCISVTEGTGDDEGKLIIASTLVPADDTIEITGGAGENEGKCLISAVIPSVCESLVEGDGINITKDTPITGKCTISAAIPSVCESLVEGDGINITKDTPTNGKCTISAAIPSVCASLVEGNYIIITKDTPTNGKCTIAVNETKLRSLIDARIRAWFNNPSNVTKC